jgi:hypothetical protein
MREGSHNRAAPRQRHHARHYLTNSYAKGLNSKFTIITRQVGVQRRVGNYTDVI